MLYLESRPGVVLEGEQRRQLVYTHVPRVSATPEHEIAK